MRSFWDAFKVVWGIYFTHSDTLFSHQKESHNQTNGIMAIDENTLQENQAPTKYQFDHGRDVQTTKWKPKSSGKAAETRHLFTFGHQIFLDTAAVAVGADTFYNTMVHLMKFLYSFYLFFGMTLFDAQLATSSVRNFCVLYAVLQRQIVQEVNWALEPTCHMLMHFVEAQIDAVAEPSDFWLTHMEISLALSANWV